MPLDESLSAVIDLRSRKEEHKRKVIAGILEKLRQGRVIVEGKHDSDVLKKLGIESLTYEKVMKGNVKIPEDKTVFIITDLDRRGREKAEALNQFLVAKNMTTDNSAGKSLLRMLNSACVEEIYAPVMQALEMRNW